VNKVQRAQAKWARERARDNERFRAANAYRVGQTCANAGSDLQVGQEWDTPDGFRVRQVEAYANPFEPGHYVGFLEVLGFAQSRMA
jgi:hypothetical protein